MKPSEAQSKQVRNIFPLLGYHAGITGLSCNGDSGGPLVEFNSTEEHYVQVGIAQGGTCMSRTKPAIFSRIEDPDIFEFITKEFRNTIIPTTEATTITTKTTTTTMTTTTSIPATILRTIASTPIEEAPRPSSTPAPILSASEHLHSVEKYTIMLSR